MTRPAISDRIIRAGTPPSRADLQARCVSPGKGDWRLNSLTSDPVLAQALASELELYKVNQAYMLMDGLNPAPVVWPEALSEAFDLPHGKTVSWHPGQAAQGIWLRRGAALVLPLNGRPVLVARSGEEYLAMRHCPDAIDLIRSAFDSRGFASSTVTVYGLFGAPILGQDYYPRIRDRCKEYGMKIAYEHRLSLNGVHAYETHSDPAMRRKFNLGIVRYP